MITIIVESNTTGTNTITGFAFLVDGGAILWGSRKQELVTLSTAESEFIATTHAAKDTQWLHQLIGEVFRPLQHPVTLYSIQLLYCPTENMVADTLMKALPRVKVKHFTYE